MRNRVLSFVYAAASAAIIYKSSFLLIVTWASFVVGVPGNLLSAVAWLRADMTSRNSSAVYLGALSIVELVAVNLLVLRTWFADHPVDIAMSQAVFMLFNIAAGIIMAVSVQQFIVYRFPSRVS